MKLKKGKFIIKYTIAYTKKNEKSTAVSNKKMRSFRRNCGDAVL